MEISVWDVIDGAGATDETRELGERKATVSFDLYYSGDGSTATIEARAGETATIEYFGASVSTSTSVDIENGDLDIVSFSAGNATAPAALTVKALELVNKL